MTAVAKSSLTTERRRARALARRDPAAWREFVREFNSLIYKMILRAGCDRDHVDDIVQEVYASLIDNGGRRLLTWDPSRCRLSTWVGLIAYRTALTTHKLRKFRGFGPGLKGDVFGAAFNEDDFTQVLDERPDAYEGILAREERETTRSESRSAPSTRPSTRSPVESARQ